MLLVLADPLRRACVAALLEAAGLPVLLAEGGLHALTQLERARPEALLVDAEPGDLSAEELHEIVRSEPGTAGVPFLLIAERAPGWLGGPQDRLVDPWRTSAGLVQVLAESLGGPAERPSQLRGTLESVGLFELAGTLSTMQKTGCLELSPGGGEALILLRAGEIGHAEYRAAQGEEALLDLFAQVQTAPETPFRFGRLPAGLSDRLPQTIHTPTARLLLELAVHLDHATHF